MSNSLFPIPDLTPLLKGAFWLFVFTITLALWKLADIAIWCRHHTHIHFGG